MATQQATSKRRRKAFDRTEASPRWRHHLGLQLKPGVPRFLRSHGYRLRRGIRGEVLVCTRTSSYPVLVLRPSTDGRFDVAVWSDSRYSSGSLQAQAPSLQMLSESDQGQRLLGILNLMTSPVFGAPREARPTHDRITFRGVCSGGLPTLGQRR